MAIECEFDSTAEFANTLIIGAIKGTFQQAVCQCNIINQSKETGNANGLVYLFVIVQARNLDDKVSVDFPFCECQCFHFCFVLVRGTGRVRRGFIINHDANIRIVFYCVITFDYFFAKK